VDKLLNELINPVVVTEDEDEDEDKDDGQSLKLVAQRSRP
jgi:hypothetical protein